MCITDSHCLITAHIGRLLLITGVIVLRGYCLLARNFAQIIFDAQTACQFSVRGLQSYSGIMYRQSTRLQDEGHS